ncbi:MAG TPA: type II toxin-antitoxin system death-on-curing family toxin [Tepidisphaeraceae bacterium]|jgi:death-on-curing protein
MTKRHPLFLTLDEIIALHQRLIEEFGGTPGVRDHSLLQSALAMPQASFGGLYLHSTIAEMGAAYLFHLVMNHAFVDGNKRIGAAAARVFLTMNDAQFDPEEKQYGDLVLALAAAQIDKADVIAFFNQHVRLNAKRARRRRK